MTFENYAKNLLEDFNTRKLDEDGDIYTYTPKYFDITEIFLSYDIMTMIRTFNLILRMREI